MSRHEVNMAQRGRRSSLTTLSSALSNVMLLMLNAPNLPQPGHEIRAVRPPEPQKSTSAILVSQNSLPSTIGGEGVHYSGTSESSCQESVNRDNILPQVNSAQLSSISFLHVTTHVFHHLSLILDLNSVYSHQETALQGSDSSFHPPPTRLLLKGRR